MIYLYKQIIMFENLTTMKKNVSLIEIISTSKYVSIILLVDSKRFCWFTPLLKMHMC